MHIGVITNLSTYPSDWKYVKFARGSTEAAAKNYCSRRNFRKKISLKNWLQELDEFEYDVPHRPGKLYKLKPDLLNGDNII